MFIRHHLAPALAHLPLQDLRPDHIQRLYNQTIDKGLSPGTVHGIHVVLRAALKQAVRLGLVIHNVTDAVTLPRSQPRKISPMTLAQVRHLLSVAKQDRLFPVVFLALGTDMRRGELLALRWQDVNLDTGVLHVRQAFALVWMHNPDKAARKTRLLLQEPKTEHSRRAIPIPESIIDEMRHHKARQAQGKLLMGQAYQDDGLVFAEPDGRPIFPGTLTRRFKRLLGQAGLSPMRWHDIRHSFATLLLEQGEHPKTVQVILGHSKVSTTLDTYSHVSLDLEKRAAARLNASLQGPSSR